MKISYAAPKVTAYNFMRYLFASLTKENNIIIDKSMIVDNIYNFMLNSAPDLLFIFEDIEFRQSVKSVVSYDINEGINNLQTLGVIGKLNPTYEKIVVYLTEQDADAILDSCEPLIKDTMRQLAITFSR